LEDIQYKPYFKPILDYLKSYDIDVTSFWVSWNPFDQMKNPGNGSITVKFSKKVIDEQNNVEDISNLWELLDFCFSTFDKMYREELKQHS
jgi:hypothetical protein